MSTGDDDDDRGADRITKSLFSDSGDHETCTFVEKSGCLILHKSNTF